MTKPFKWEILTARIHNLLAQRRQQQNEFKQNAEAEAKDVTISPADEDFLNKALRFVEKNMDNSEYSVDELSDDMAMSRATLFRKMRSVIGMSPTDFIRNTRLKRAAQLITEGRLSVTEIAYSVGYSVGNFLSKYKRFPSMRVLLALTVMGKKAGADVLTATTRRLIRPIAVWRKRLRSSWRKANAFSGESIRT